MLSNELANELKQILSEEYHLDLDYKQTLEVGEFLLGYFEALSSIRNTINIKDKYGTTSHDC